MPHPTQAILGTRRVPRRSARPHSDRRCGSWPSSQRRCRPGAVLFRARDLLVRQRTQIINALRGHLSEFGLIGAKGRENALKLMKLVDETATSLPASARSVLSFIGRIVLLSFHEWADIAGGDQLDLVPEPRDLSPPCSGYLRKFPSPPRIGAVPRRP
jgi:hypothetical protein